MSVVGALLRSDWWILLVWRPFETNRNTHEEDKTLKCVVFFVVVRCLLFFVVYIFVVVFSPHLVLVSIESFSLSLSPPPPPPPPLPPSLPPYPSSLDL